MLISAYKSSGCFQAGKEGQVLGIWEHVKHTTNRNTKKKQTQYLVVGKFDHRLGTGENEVVGEDDNGRGWSGGNEEGSRSCPVTLLFILQKVKFAKSCGALQTRSTIARFNNGVGGGATLGRKNHLETLPLQNCQKLLELIQKKITILYGVSECKVGVSGGGPFTSRHITEPQQPTNVQEGRF